MYLSSAPKFGHSLLIHFSEENDILQIKEYVWQIIGQMDTWQFSAESLTYSQRLSSSTQYFLIITENLTRTI